MHFYFPSERLICVQSKKNPALILLRHIVLKGNLKIQPGSVFKKNVATYDTVRYCRKVVCPNLFVNQYIHVCLFVAILSRIYLHTNSVGETRQMWHFLEGRHHKSCRKPIDTYVYTYFPTLKTMAS
jgi:hypothetical protein